MLRYKGSHALRSLRCGEAFEEVFQIRLGLDLVRLSVFSRENGMALASAPIGTPAKSQYFLPRATGRLAFSATSYRTEQSAVLVAHGPTPLVAGIGHGPPEQVYSSQKP